MAPRRFSRKPIRAKIEALLPQGFSPLGRGCARMAQPGEGIGAFVRRPPQVLAVFSPRRPSPIPTGRRPRTRLRCASWPRPRGLGAAVEHGSVTLVGAGPGDPGTADACVRCARCNPPTSSCSTISSRAEVLDFARREARKILVGKTGHAPSCKQDEINALMVKLAEAGQRVVRLKGWRPADLRAGRRGDRGLPGGGDCRRDRAGGHSSARCRQPAGRGADRPEDSLRPQARHRLPPRDPAEHERAQHRHRVRRGAVEVPGDLAGGVEARDRRAAAEHARAGVGRKPAEGVGDGADDRPGEERRLDDGARPVRFRRRERRATRRGRRRSWRRTFAGRRCRRRCSPRPCARARPHRRRSAWRVRRAYAASNGGTSERVARCQSGIARTRASRIAKAVRPGTSKCRRRANASQVSCTRPAPSSKKRRPSRSTTMP